MWRWLLALGLLATGCECGSQCSGVTCGACPPALSLTIITDGAMPTIAGDVDLFCSTVGVETTCSSRPDEPLAPGPYLFVISAAGHATTEASLMLEPGGSGCCSCPLQADHVRVELGATDGGFVSDGGSAPDAGDPMQDAGLAPDAGAAVEDAGGAANDGGLACRPERVEGNPFEPGSFCDELYACVSDEAEAARVEAAAPGFECAPGPRCAGLRCDYSASSGAVTIDDATYEEVCAVTVLEPPPESIVCWVWL